jgi:hypothetical protein
MKMLATAVTRQLLQAMSLKVLQHAQVPLQLLALGVPLAHAKPPLRICVNNHAKCPTK